MPSLSQDYFVNRDSFFNAVYEELAELDDDRTSRVLVIHGQAGIGKSALSREIKRRFEEGEGIAAYAREGFEVVQPDFVKYLGSLAHSLRGAVKDSTFDMYHFSFAQAIYYHKRREAIPKDPSLMLPLTKDFLNIVTRGVIPSNTIEKLVEIYGPKLMRFFNRSDREFYNELILSEPEIILEKLPYYFAQDLELETQNDRKAVILLDALDPERIPYDSQEWIRTLVEESKGTLFIITSREELDWTGYDVNVPIRPEAIDELEDKYSLEVLNKAGITRPELTDAIIKSSGGVPLWLEVCIGIYRKKKDKASLTPDDFRGTKKNLLDRYLRGLTEPEVKTLKVIACAVSFDYGLFVLLVDMFKTGFDNPEDNFERKFVQRFRFITKEDNRYIMHDLIRRHLKEELKKETSKWGQVNEIIVTYYNELRIILQKNGRYNDALAVAQSNLTQVIDYYKYNHPNTANILNSIAGIFDDIGSYANALEFYKKSIEIFDKLDKDSYPDIAYHRSVLYNNVGLLLNNKGDYKAAKEYLELALSVKGDEHSPNAPLYATTYMNLGIVHQATNHLEIAEQHFMKAFELQKEVTELDPSETAGLYYNIASLCFVQKNCKKSIDFFKKAIKLEKDYLGLDHPSLAKTYYHLALVFLHIRSYEEASVHLNKAFSIQKEKLNADHPDLGLTYSALAQLYFLLGEDDKKIMSYFTKAEDILSKQLPIKHPLLVSLYETIAAYYQMTGRGKLADEYRSKIPNSVT
jgi:tetratricopeptide (TPR) repeat protein